jgi:hypothetical protein
LLKCINIADAKDRVVYKTILWKLYKKMALQHALLGNFKKAEKLASLKIRDRKIKKLINKMKIARRLSD